MSNPTLVNRCLLTAALLTAELPNFRAAYAANPTQDLSRAAAAAGWCISDGKEPPFFGPTGFKLSAKDLALKCLTMPNGSQRASLADLFGQKSHLVVMPVLQVDCPRSPEGAQELAKFAAELRKAFPKIDLEFAFVVKGDIEDLRKYPVATRASLRCAADQSGFVPRALKVPAAGGICVIDRAGNVLFSVSKYGKTPFDTLVNKLKDLGIISNPNFELQAEYPPPSQACPFFADHAGPKEGKQKK